MTAAADEAPRASSASSSRDRPARRVMQKRWYVKPSKKETGRPARANLPVWATPRGLLENLTRRRRTDLGGRDGGHVPVDRARAVDVEVALTRAALRDGVGSRREGGRRGRAVADQRGRGRRARRHRHGVAALERRVGRQVGA